MTDDANGQQLLQMGGRREEERRIKVWEQGAVLSGGRREEERRKGLEIRRCTSLYSLLQKTAAMAASLASCWVCLTQRRRRCALSGWGPRSL